MRTCYFSPKMMIPFRYIDDGWGPPAQGLMVFIRDAPNAIGTHTHSKTPKLFDGFSPSLSHLAIISHVGGGCFNGFKPQDSSRTEKYLLHKAHEHHFDELYLTMLCCLVLELTCIFCWQGQNRGLVVWSRPSGSCFVAEDMIGQVEWN